jgi:N-acetylneuraminic acid mutarotase
MEDFTMWLFSSTRKTQRTVPVRSARNAFHPRLELLEDRSVPSAGALDPTFGSGGTVTGPIQNCNALVVQPADGKILTAGDLPSGKSTNFALARYNSNGTLDSAFGHDYTFTSADLGTHVFSATLKTAGTQSLTATDTTTASISGSVSGIVVSPPTVNTWSATGNLTSPRSLFQATLLESGKVLVTGGIDASGKVLSNTELFDPATGTWSLAAPMATAREQPTATLLHNGEVLVVGGFDAHTTFASAEVYDPVSDTWSPAGNLATARSAQTATLLPSGLVLVTGGVDANLKTLASAELYNPTTKAWSPAGSMATPRVFHTTTLLASGKVLVTGGGDDSSELASAEIYDPVTNTWSAAASMASPRFEHAATLLNDGSVLVTGGADGQKALAGAELYDPASNTWSATASMAFSRQDHTSTLLNNGSVLVAGGDITGTSAELYDPTTRAWSATGSMATGRSGQTATLLNNGLLLVAGGNGSGTSVLSSAELYHPTGVAQLAVNVPSGITVIAGSPFLVTAQAIDALGNPVTSYQGPTSVTVAASPIDAQVSAPVTGTLNGSGFGFFLANLKTAGSYTLTATAGTISSSGASITVIPADANYFTVSAPAAATTGNAMNVTVKAFDHFGNLATGYKGQVHFTSTDASAVLPSGSTVNAGVGVFSVTLNSAGSQTIAATDSVSTNPTITGTSGAIATRGLAVSSFTPTVNGFTAAFTKPFVPQDVTLYGPNARTVQDVTLVGAATGPIAGSLVVDPSSMKITFHATASSLALAGGAPVLPDDTYTAIIVSRPGLGGFHDALGGPLDGASNAGHANYVTTFTTHYQGSKAPIFTIPDFARGPDPAHAIKAPNDSSHGIPITIYNASKMTEASFELIYDPTLFTISGAGGGDATDPASSLRLVDAHAGGANIAIFEYQSIIPESGTVNLGDILATVPASAAATYKAKELLQLVPVTIDGVQVAQPVAFSALHLDAYLGDVTGNGSIDALDVATAATVAQGAATGFAAYALLDPALIGDPANDLSVDAGDVSTLAAFTTRLPTPTIPAPPTGLTITPVGADPTLSLGQVQSQGEKQNGRQGDGIDSPPLPFSLSGRSSFSVPILLDNPHPEGSVGMTEAVLALTYDPALLNVMPADITLDSLPSRGTGWQLVAVVDPERGHIGITLFSTAPITDPEGGSLVNIIFHLNGEPSGVSRRSTAAARETPLVQLVERATAGGQEFVTQVDDTQGQLTLSPGADLLMALPEPHTQRRGVRAARRIGS